MSKTEPVFELSRDIEHYLATLSKIYKRDQMTEKLEIIVNAKIRIHEQWDYDNWDGGISGHALFLSLPEDVYIGLIEERNKLQNAICSDINKLHNIQNEHMSEVFIEMERGEDRDWRRESGALVSALRTVSPEAAIRVWGNAGYRVFLSHKTEARKEASELKEQLAAFGISAFVAHQDIKPTKEWQEEIENALTTMDAFVALLTEDFHNSNWTDQEVGFALGRGVRVICVKLGCDPYGFIGKFQALATSWTDAPIELAKLFISNSQLMDSYIRRMEKCGSFSEGFQLAKILSHIAKITSEQADQMVAAFNGNSQLKFCYAFNGIDPEHSGPGLVPFLSKVTGSKYVMSESGEIQKEK